MMGLKSMFRSGNKQGQDSPKPSPKTSRAGSPPRDDVSVASRASSGRGESREEQAGEAGRSEGHVPVDRVAELEKELSKSRWEVMMMRDKIAELEHKAESGGGWQTFPSEEQRAKEEALEERNKQLREKVRDLQEELERLQEGSSRRSSIEDKSARSNASANNDDRDKEQMAERIKELEARLEESTGGNFDGLTTKIKSLEQQLGESREEMEEVLKERDELKEALQDAGDARGCHVLPMSVRVSTYPGDSFPTSNIS